MQTKHALYYSQYCYFCQKVLMYLRGKEHEIVLRSTSERDNMRTLAQGGGKTQVPCLLIESGVNEREWMYESADILSYIKSNSLAKG